MLVVPRLLCEEEGGGVCARVCCVRTVPKPRWKREAETTRNACGQERGPWGGAQPSSGDLRGRTLLHDLAFLMHVTVSHLQRVK